MSAASLSVDVRLERADFSLEVAFDLPAGATLAIIGPNGAGKSTLLDAIAGHAVLERGAIRVDGADLATPTRMVPAEKRPISVVRQDPLLFPHLTTIGNVEFGLRTRGVDKASRRQRALDALRNVDLIDHADTAVSELSGGQAQRASVARALVIDQPVLLLDEPLSRVDVANRRLIRGVLAEVEATQVIVTHGKEHARDCDQILAIDQGSVVARGTPSELTADPPTAWLAELLA